MATSQNGWTVATKDEIHYYPVPGDTAANKGTIAVRKGAVAVVLVDLMGQLQKLEAAVWPGEWGWYVRPIRGQSSGYSNHASGTAIDWNAPKHPRQSFSRTRGWSAVDVAAIQALLHGRYRGLIRWGAQYISRPYDPMHFEIIGSAAQVNSLAAWILRENDPTPAPAPVVEEVEMFIVSRKDEAEQYVSNGIERRWISDGAHRDIIVSIGAKVYDIFTTEAGMSAVGGPLTGPESPAKLAREGK